jgi:hypothetical protein
MDYDFLSYWWKKQPLNKKITYYLFTVGSIYLSIKIVIGV